MRQHNFQVGDRVRITTKWGLEHRKRGTVVRLPGKWYDQVRVRIDGLKKRRVRSYNATSLEADHPLIRLAECAE